MTLLWVTWIENIAASTEYFLSNSAAKTRIKRISLEWREHFTSWLQWPNSECIHLNWLKKLLMESILIEWGIGMSASLSIYLLCLRIYVLPVISNVLCGIPSIFSVTKNIVQILLIFMIYQKYQFNLISTKLIRN